ncbi:hypothetical protein Ahy_A02g006545 [Arachis hypogaea]|uniref:Protein FAR1-RELATED SEQUENCE n=1 Tax=Arachis hypogaea TaxID=3818 RepID=A0A445EA38_ARAHY|nr:hypothetical protein Ahy_A02g006545 [Arachis hypogaea]
MENDGKESYKDADQSEDLSVKYECSSDESDDMVDVTVNEAKADIINVDGFEKLITDLTIEDIWGLVFDTKSQEKDIGSTLKGTIDKGSIGQLLMSTARRGFVSFVTIERGIYNDKVKWATTNLREHFFGRIRTTSQCEGIHSLLKNYVDNKINLLEFMHKFSEVLRHYRNNHLTTDFETFYKFPVLTTCLKSFEKQAAELYTRNIFKLVKDEIEAAGALNVTEYPNSGDIVEYNTSEYFTQQWQFKVSYNKDKDLFACECRLFETRGLPCSHIFGVLKHRKAKCVPISLILKSWTREADYRKISSELLKLISKVQNKSDAQARLSPTSALIGDPVVVKSKGAPRKVPKGQKRRRCSHSKSRKHFIRTCPLLVNEDSPAEYSNTEDKLTQVEECDSSKQTRSQDTRSVENSPLHNNNNFKITITQETLKEKTNTSEIVVSEVTGAPTTKIPGSPQYPMHHYPVVHPYRRYGGVLPIQFHPIQNGTAYFNLYPSTAGITSYPQCFHVSSYSSRPSDTNTWVGLLHDVINSKKP